jgi:8-oxo-dGTP pyrophosphatase MutT (NUDIX family)
MIEGTIVAAILGRLTSALAPPSEPLVPLRIGDVIVGWLDHRRALRLAAFADVFDTGADGVALSPRLADPAGRSAALDCVARTLAAEGQLTAWRDERYAVVARFDAEPLFLLERAAARYFGIRTFAAHVNGIVRDRGTVVGMWFARRSPTKAIDPGLLDNLVGGGIAAGESIESTVVKEAQEEAGIDAILARRAQRAGTVEICRAQPDGLQRETIFVHDLELPQTFEPVCVDGEAVGHRLVDLAGAARLIANSDGPDVVTVDASVVVTDFLLRHGSIAAAAPEFAALAALRRPQRHFA